MLDDHSVTRASKSHAELVEAGFYAVSGRIRGEIVLRRAQDDFPLCV